MIRAYDFTTKILIVKDERECYAALVKRIFALAWKETVWHLSRGKHYGPTYSKNKKHGFFFLMLCQKSTHFVAILCQRRPCLWRMKCQPFSRCTADGYGNMPLTHRVTCFCSYYTRVESIETKSAVLTKTFSPAVTLCLRAFGQRRERRRAFLFISLSLQPLRSVFLNKE